MLQNPCKTLGFKKNMVYEIPPGWRLTISSQWAIFSHPYILKVCDIIQLMHSFEVNIRICQPENSNVHRGKAEVSITFEGNLIQMSTGPVSFLKFYLKYFHIYKFTSALSLGRLFQQYNSQISATLMR